MCQAETSSWLDVLLLWKVSSVRSTPQKRTLWFGGQFPQRPEAHLRSRGRAPHDANEESKMDLCIDYGRQSVLPGCFMKSIYQYQTGDKSEMGWLHSDRISHARCDSTSRWNVTEGGGGGNTSNTAKKGHWLLTANTLESAQTRDWTFIPNRA